MFLTSLETLATTAFQGMAVVENQVEVALRVKSVSCKHETFFPHHSTIPRKSKLFTKHQGT
jgi:hypothetical protein